MARFFCEPVTTTRRQGSSPSKKAAMRDAQGGICPLCTNPMVAGEKVVDEHLDALGLGGSNDRDNRALVHAVCAYVKTHGRDGDLARINKAKAQQRAIFGLKAPKQKIRSAPFPKSEPAHRASTPLIKSRPPRRSVYVTGAN